MAGKYFNFSEVLSYGWNVMKANLWLFVGLGFLFLIITCIPNIIEIIALIAVAIIAAHLNFPGPILIVLVVLIKIVTTILDWIISIVVGIGLIKIALGFSDEQKPTIGTLFDIRDCFWRYLGATILFSPIMLGIVVPCALAPRLLRATHFPYLLPLIILLVVVIVLAVRFGIQFGLCHYFVIDKGLGPVRAFKASSRTTMGAKWQLLGFGILCGLINLLGLFCLVVGVFAAYPTTMVASALVYRRLLTQTPELAEFGIVPTSVEPTAQSLPDEQESLKR